MLKRLKASAVYLIAPILSLIIFAAFFELWKVDFSMPFFRYNNDGLFYFFLIKSILDNGWISLNQFVGLPHFTTIFSLNDFPQQAEFFNLILIKFFALFSNNVFLVSNCFLLCSFALVSFSSFIALRSFAISNFTAVLVGILYAFLPYHFARNSWHLFLSNYLIVPFAAMIGVWVLMQKINLVGANKKEQYCLEVNRYFYLAFAISCFAAMNGFYYAAYFCLILVFSWFLSSLKTGKFLGQNFTIVFVLCAVVIVVLILLYFPVFKNFHDFGTNNRLMIRYPNESETFGLKIVNIFLPVANHYIHYFRNIREIFNDFTREDENAGGFGIVGSAGFLFLLLWLLAKNQDSGKIENVKSFFRRTIDKFSLDKNDQKLISSLAGLNFVTLLFATVSGFVMFIAVTMPMIRSHARLSIFIAFFSLSLIAIIFDKIIEKNFFGQKNIGRFFVFVIFSLALFDQVGRVSSATIQPKRIKELFVNDRDFIAEVEKSLAPQSMIFVFPVLGFPEQSGDDYQSLIAYIHSKNLRWSYPAVAGRESNLWQEKIAKLNFKDFIKEIKAVGFSGVYIDRFHYVGLNSWGDLRKLEAQLKSVSKGKRITSRDMRLVFFEI